MNEQKLQFVDIYSVWYQPWWQSKAWYAFCGLTACFLIGFVLFYGYRRGLFSKKLSYDQQALKNLHDLLTTSYDRPDAIYAAYFQLTMILKKYFAIRYNLNLVDKTDFEIVPLLQGNISLSLQAELDEFLHRAFVIKFAHEQISESMLHDDIKLLQKIIEQTCKDLDKVGPS